jgi:hypothetical protein
MDINHGDRRRRWLSRRIIWSPLLLLVFLLPLNAGTWQEEDFSFCINGELSTCISGVRVIKNIIISDSLEKEPSISATHYFTSCHLICGANCFSFLPRPYCRYCPLPWLSFPSKGAVGKDVIYSVVDGSVNDRDSGALAAESGGSEPIVLNLITQENSSRIWVEGHVVPMRGRGLAIYKIGCQPKTVINRADIGPELPVLYINRGEPLFASEDGGESGGRKSQKNPDRSNPIVQVAMLALGAGCSGLGFWQMFSPRRDPFGPLRVASLLVVGWWLLVAGGIWLSV